MKYSARKEMLKAIITFIEEHRYPPTVDELAEITGRHRNTIRFHISNMIESGMLQTDCCTSPTRAIRVPGYKFIRIKEDELVKFKVLLDNKDIKMPTKAHAADAGFDIYAPYDFIVPASGSRTINTGVHIEIPEGYVGFLKSKSGLNVKNGIRGEGVIDAGYTGSIVVKLYNDSCTPVDFKEGQKIIQIVFLPIPDVELELTESFEATERGDNGFGSTGQF